MKSKQIQAFKESEIGKIPQDWNIEKLDDIIETILDRRGITPKKLNSDWVGTGFPVISAKNIKNGFLIRTETIRFVDNQTYEKWMSKKIKMGDIILTSEGPLGELYYVEDFKEFCIGQRLFAIRKNPKKIDGKFLFFYLRSMIGQQQLSSRITGSTVSGIRQEELRKILVCFPKELEEQQKIGRILSELIKKIENLKNQNKILEQIAQSIYKSWFINFDGVTEFEDSELGQIPKDCRIENLEYAVELFDSKRIPLSQMERSKIQGKFPYYGASGVIDHLNDYIFDGDYLLIAEDGENLRSRNTPIAFFASGKFWVNNHAHIIKGKNYFNIMFLWIFFKKINLNPWITGAAQPKLNQENLLSIPIIVPPSQKLLAYNYISENIFKSIQHNNLELETLTKIYDSILPKLMSGEIRV